MLQATSKIWMDGKFVPWKNAKVHFLTHTLHYGSGVFEGIRAYKAVSGKYAIFRLKDHVKRMFHSAKTLEMSLPYNEHEIYNAIIRTLRANERACGGADSIYIRPLVYYGYGKLGLDPTGAEVDIGIACWPWGAYLGAKAQKSGISATSSFLKRMYSTPEIAHAKITGHYSNSILAKHDAHRKGYDEAIMYDLHEKVAEGTGENIFIVKNGKLITPPAGSILLGITRDTLIRIARDFKIPVLVRFFGRRQLYNADEAFLCGTAAEITPIREIDDKKIGRKCPGASTEMLREIYLDIVHGKIAKYAKWLDYVK